MFFGDNSGIGVSVIRSFTHTASTTIIAAGPAARGELLILCRALAMKVAAAATFSAATTAASANFSPDISNVAAAATFSAATAAAPLATRVVTLGVPPAPLIGEGSTRPECHHRRHD